MSINEKDSIKAKIKALLEKTEENGASKAEMETALRLANKLMLENYISEHELSDPYINEKCELIEVPLIKSAYDMKIFYAHLSRLFDCEHYYNSRRIAFFGFKEDVQLCAFFYTTIIKSTMYEKDRYMKSSHYNLLRMDYHGKSLVSSFIKGFLVEISIKMDQMYEDRSANQSELFGLVPVDKMKRVSEQFDATNTQLKVSKNKALKGIKESFLKGVEKGKDFQIVQGINDGKKNSIFEIGN